MRITTSKLSRLVACSLFSATLVAGAAFAVAGNNVPFAGSASGSVVDVVPVGSSLQLTILASGQANQLGHFDRTETLLLDPATGAVSGSIVFVAANQDELHVTFAGGFVSPTTAQGTYTVVGGTGRFADASGSADFEAVSPDGVQVSVSFAGTLEGFGGQH